MIQHFSFTFFPFFDFATQLFFTPVTSSNLRNQAPLFTELRLLQATRNFWLSKPFGLDIASLVCLYCFTFFVFQRSMQCSETFVFINSQNNLMEYWCMVDFVRPSFLGTKNEFSNMFERPIQNGQCSNSNEGDVRLMRFRSHVLHSLLKGFVQRR